METKIKNTGTSYKLSRQERKAVLFMIFPALTELLLSHTFALIDSAMLGFSADATTSVAAVGLTSSLVGMIGNLIAAFTVGTTATVAWFLGSRHPEDAKATVRQTTTISGILGIVLTLVCTFGSKGIVGFMGSSDEAVRTAATEYFSIISIGYVFQFLTVNISAALRGAKITKYTMIYNLIANAANVGMNYVLIFGKLGFEPMGLKGAAIATTVSKILGFLIAIGVVCLKKSPVQISLKKSFVPRQRIMQRVIRISLTAMLEQLLLQGGNVLFTKIIAGIPKVDFSAYNIAGNITGFVWNISAACAVASTTYMGIGMGEGREDKCRGYTAYIVRTCFLWMSVLTTVLVAGAGFWPRLFINDPDVISMAAKILPIAALYGLPVAIHQPLAGALRSAGDTTSPLIASFASLWIFRVLLGWLLIRVFDLGIIFGTIAVAADQTVRAAINIILYRSGRWKKRISGQNSRSTSREK